MKSVGDGGSPGHWTAPPKEAALTLARGGPFFSLLKVTGLIHGDGLDVARPALALLAFTWLPLLLLAAISRDAGRLVADFAVHARLLIAIPLLLKADGLLHVLCSGAIERFSRARMEEGSEPRMLEALVRRTERLWNSAGGELLFLLIGLLFGQLTLWKAAPIPIRLPETVHYPISAAALWYCVIGLPVFNFLLLRSLWRWMVWSQLLWRFSRLEMRLIPTNPDLCCGLEPLTIPCHGFAVILLAAGASIAGTWASQIVFLGTALTSFDRSLASLVVLALVFGLGPLAAFSGKLYRAKIKGRAQYGALARTYTTQFHERWIVERKSAGLLGSPDIQSLADLANSYAIVLRTRLTPFGWREVGIIASAILAPMIPLVLTVVSLREVASKLVGAFF
ncbi:MAG: hypothetical protein HY901_14595 [Deltaproteobacteria bacterium]|nr:hypothetical protein [Deltaproteobacteria bacterium]